MSHALNVATILACAERGHILDHYTELNDGTKWHVCQCGKERKPYQKRRVRKPTNGR